MNNSISQQIPKVNSYSNNLVVRENIERKDNDLVTIVPSYKGSNDYTVSIHLSKSFHAIVAGIIAPDGKKFAVAQSRILNGLTGQPLSVEQIQAISINQTNAFNAVYLPNTQRVFIWPIMKAAGKGDNLMMNNQLNPFIGKNLSQVTQMLGDKNFRIPSTNKTVGDLLGGKFSNPEDKNNGKIVKESFLATKNGISVHYDIGKKKEGFKEGEPVHVGVSVWTNGGKELITTNYPINPNDPGWDRIIKDQKPIYKDPQYEACPKNKSKGGGGGGNSGSGGGSTGGFNNNLSQNGLTKSYNSTNPNNPLPEAQGADGEIGGVAIHDPNAIMVNMQHSLYDLTADGYWLVFKDIKRSSFSNQQLRQIIRELAQTIYIHNTFPFYSLHFTKKGTLYSVIHPAYQNTLVGKVISMLDYFMKGYLNGGYFNEADLESFARDKRWVKDYSELKPHMRSIDALYRSSLPDDEYTSLAQLIEQYQIKQYNTLDKILGNEALAELQQRFQISFRIIAKQDSIEKSGGTLLFNGNFNVFYTIELHKGVIGKLDKYMESDEYQLLDHFCKMVAKDIKEKLPQLAICKDYFAMLDVICGLSYYFSSLKRQELMPSLEAIEIANTDKAFGMLPPYPKTKIETAVNKHSLWDFIQKLDARSSEELKIFLAGDVKVILPKLQTKLAKVIQRMLPDNALKFTASDLNELVILLMNNALRCVNEYKTAIFSKEMSQNLQKLQENIIKANENIDAHHNMFLDLQVDFAQGQSELQTKEQQNIYNQMVEIERQKAEALKDLDKEAAKQKEQIDDIYIGYNQQISYKNKSYQSYELSSLKSRMRQDLEQQIKEQKNRLDGEIKTVKKKALQEIAAHWGKFQTQLRNEYKQNEKKIQEHIAKVQQSLDIMAAEYKRITDLRKNIINDPTNIAIAKDIELSLPAIVKALDVLGFKDDKQLVKINGGTGFRLNDINIDINTALSSNLSQRFTKNSITKFIESAGDYEGEGWQTVTVNGKEYNGFYLSHAYLNDKHALEQSLIKPGMAKTEIEKKFIQLALQPVSSEQILELEKLISENPQLNFAVTDAYGNNALHLAAMNNNEDLVKLLLKYNISLLNQNQFGNTPAHVAAMYGHNEIIKRFYALNKQSIKQLTMNEESLLQLAVLHHNLSTVKLLVAYGLDINEIGIDGAPLIYTALFNASLEITNYLLSHSHININFQMENGNTLLHIAAKLNTQEIIQHLLMKKVDIVYNRNGKNALHIAIENGYIDAVSLLINNDKSLINQADGAGATPVILALQSSQSKIAEYLIDAGAAINIETDGENALTYAIKGKHKSCAKAILRQSNFSLASELNQRNFALMCQLGLWDLCEIVTAKNNKNILVQLPILTGNKDVCCYLDYLCKTNSYITLKTLCANNTAVKEYLLDNINKVYRIAIFYKSQDVIDILRRAGFNNPYNYTDRLFEEYSPELARFKDYNLIQFATRHNLESICNSYIANKVVTDIARPTNDGKSLIYLAAESGNQQLIEELMNKGSSLIAPNGRHIFYALVEHNHHKVIRHLLLKHQLNINNIIDDKEQIRPIDLACKLGNMDMVTALISCGARIDKVNSKGHLAITYAIKNNAEHLLRLVFKYELGDLGQILAFAITEHKNEAFEQILKHRPGFKNKILKDGQKLLESAIESNNFTAFKFLLAQSAKLQPELLIKSISNGRHEMVKLLIAQGAGINAKDNQGNTPLHLACKLGQDLCVLELLKSPHLNLTIRNNQGSTAQEVAQPWISRTVLNRGNKYTDICKDLIDIIHSGGVARLEDLLAQYNIPLNTQLLYKHNGKDGYFTLLDIAILEDQPQIIEFLLAQGADAKRANSLGLSSVHLLMKLSDADFIVRMLEKYNLDINAKSGQVGITPLHMAVLIKNNALISYLISKGCDIYAEIEDGKTILQVAIEQKSLDLIKQLVTQHGYDVHHRNSKLETPLAQALAAGNLIIAEYLVDLGANPYETAGVRQRSMLHYAVMSEDVKVVLFTLSLGVDNKLVDNMHMLPLHLAAKQGNLAITELLTEGNQLLLGLQDRRGRDVKDFALIHRKNELSSYLSKKYPNNKNHTTLDKEIGFKKYKASDRTALELAILAEDKTTITKLTNSLNQNDTGAINKAIAIAGTSSNPEIFIYVVNELWNGQDLQVLRQAMMAAISNNKPANLRELLRICEADIVFEDGSTPIRLACTFEAVDCLRILLDHYAANGIDISDKEIYLSFQNIIKNNNMSLAKMLAQCCSNEALNSVDTNGHTLLHQAVLSNQPNMLAFLLMNGCVDREDFLRTTALDLAIKNNLPTCANYLRLVNNAKQANILIDYLAQVNLDHDVFKWLCSFQDVDQANAEGQTALHLAIRKQDIKAIQSLLTYGADISCMDKLDMNALDHTQATSPYIFKAIVNYARKNKQLTRIFASLGEQDKFNKILALRNNLRQAKLLVDSTPTLVYDNIKSGTSLYELLNYQSLTGHTTSQDNIFHLAIITDETKFLNMLINLGNQLDHNLDVRQLSKQRNLQGNSILHLSVMANNKTCVEESLRIIPTPSINALNNAGFNPVSLAITQNNLQLFNLLIQAGGELNQAFEEIPYSELQRAWQGSKQLDQATLQNISNTLTVNDLYRLLMPVQLNEIRNFSDTITPSLLEGLNQSNRNTKATLIRAVLVLANKFNSDSIYTLLQSAFTSGLTSLALKLAELYPDLTPRGNSALKQAYKQGDIETFKVLLETGFNPYIAFKQRLRVKNESTLEQRQIVAIYDEWYAKQLDTVRKLLEYNLNSKGIAGFIGKLLKYNLNFKSMAGFIRTFDILFPQIANECAESTEDFNTKSWNSLFVFIEMGLRKVSNIHPHEFMNQLHKHCYAVYGNNHAFVLERVMYSGFITLLGKSISQKATVS